MKINSINELIQKIRKLDISKITNNEDTIRYFKIENLFLEKLFEKYEYLTEQYLHLHREGWGVIDYGGGIGLLSYFFRISGFKDIIYVDNNNNYLSDARKIGNEIGIKSDIYCFGEIDDAIKLLDNNKNYLLISDNVIEHIYNLESFFFTIFSNHTRGKMVVIMSTSANPYNYLTKRRLKKLHHRVEYIGSHITESIRSMDERDSFFEIRKNIIRKYLEANNNKQEDITLEQLSKYTIGYKETDIIRYIDCYLKNEMKQNINIKYTNTCEPYNGNWAERIIDLKYLQKYVAVLGVTMKVEPGLFDRKNVKIFKFLRNYVLNIFIKLFPELGLKLAPYIILTFNKTV